MFSALPYAAALLVMIVTIITSIPAIEAARNPAAEQAVAIIGYFIVAGSAAFGALGICLGAARSLRTWRQERRDRLDDRRPHASGGVADGH